MEKQIMIDPKIFIRPPFWKCPNCSEENAFGVLMICENHYIRRCTKCRFDKRYGLPILNKKVIYIDQFAISNMMKVFNKDSKAYQKGTISDLWSTMFKKLDVLCKMQIIICPDSEYHAKESVLSPFYSSLKRMYELLSSGITFKDREYIRMSQIFEHMKCWISEKSYTSELQANDITSCNLNRWQERFIISFEITNDYAWVESLRESREKMAESLAVISEKWKTCENSTFEEFFEIESEAFGETCFKIFTDYYKNLEERIQNIANGGSEESFEDLLPPPAVMLIQNVENRFIKLGVEEKNSLQITYDYFHSSAIKDIPSVKISSLLYASLARKFATGRKKPPNQGMQNDIEIISLLLPYCDVMFVDNECRDYLEENPVNDILKPFKTKIYSQNNIDEFFCYLDKLKDDIPVEHIEKLKEVYGEEWIKPYVELYGG